MPANAARRRDYQIFMSPSSNPPRSDIENINGLNRITVTNSDNQDNNQVPSYDSIVDQNEYSRYLAPLAFSSPEDNPPVYSSI
jgi:hypothetical protein